MFPTAQQLQSFFATTSIPSGEREAMLYTFMKGEERYRFTLSPAESTLHIQVNKGGRIIGLFEFKNIYRFDILDNEPNKKRFQLTIQHEDSEQIVEVKWKPYFSIILKENHCMSSVAV